ncbi:hypothetical protein DIPPA_54311 [Diplonema papillatum]|nr:hypothetical protein DIPPA_54311 [Diplonema papillatum]
MDDNHEYEHVSNRSLELHSKEETETCRTGLRDASNTLRSFFGTNVLTMAWTYSVLGAALGPIATLVIAFIVYRATLSLIRVKQSLPNHHLIVSYGGVVSTVATWKGQFVVDALVAFTQFTTCVSYIAFSSKNLHSITSIPLGYCIIILVIPVIFLSMFHNPYMLAKVSLLTNAMMMTGIVIILTTITFTNSDNVDYFLPAGLPIGIATLSSSLGGITTVLDVERTMTHQPGRYLNFLTAILPLAAVFLSIVGTIGYLTYGPETCAVMSLSLKKGTWQHYAGQAVLTIGPSLECVLNSFPLFALSEKYCKYIDVIRRFALRRSKLYFCSHRAFWFIPAGGLAYGVPFFGYIASINGAIGYSSLSFLVPIAVEYLRSKKTTLEYGHHSKHNFKAPEENDGGRAVDSGKSAGVHFTINSAGYRTGGSDTEAPQAEVLPYELSNGRKVELVLIFVFGVAVVILGTVFAIMDIVKELKHTSKNSSSC